MTCKVIKQFLIVYVFTPLLLITSIKAQDFIVDTAPSGTGDQILQYTLHRGDAILMAMTGDGAYRWEAVSFNYPPGSTILFTTTQDDKYPLNHLVFSSSSSKVSIKNLYDYGNGYLVIGSYVNKLMINDSLIISNTMASSGIFILTTDYDLHLREITHYEGGILNLPQSIHHMEGHLILPISASGTLYYGSEMVYSSSRRNILFATHHLDSLAYANVEVPEAIGEFYLGDYAIEGDTVYVVGEFKDSIYTQSDTVINTGFYPDPVLFKYVPEVGIITAYSFGGSYRSNSNRLLLKGDTMIVIGNFIGGIEPEPGTVISVGENAGIYVFYYTQGKYQDAHVLFSDAFLFYTAAELLAGKLYLSFSFIKDVDYRESQLNTAESKNSFAVLEIEDIYSDGRMLLLPFSGSGSFPFVQEQKGMLSIYGTCHGINIENEEFTEGYDVIHLRKREEETSVKNEEEENSKIIIYPQPAENVLRIDGISEGRVKSYALYDISGKLLQSGNFSGEIRLRDSAHGYGVLILYDMKGRVYASKSCIY